MRSVGWKSSTVLSSALFLRPTLRAAAIVRPMRTSTQASTEDSEMDFLERQWTVSSSSLPGCRTEKSAWPYTSSIRRPPRATHGRRVSSFVPETPVVAVYDWDRVVVYEIELGEETCRVRYTACGMDSSRAGEGVRDSYGPWFWPAPATPDTQSSGRRPRRRRPGTGRLHQEATRSPGPVFRNDA